MNAPDRQDVFIPPDEGSRTEKLTYTPDSKLPRGGTYRIVCEDHTLGNILRMQLLRDATVTFAAYQIRHPLEYDIYVRVQVKEGHSSPHDAMKGAFTALKGEMKQLDDSFQRAVQQYKEAQGGGDEDEEMAY